MFDNAMLDVRDIPVHEHDSQEAAVLRDRRRVPDDWAQGLWIERHGNGWKLWYTNDETSVEMAELKGAMFSAKAAFSSGGAHFAFRDILGKVRALHSRPDEAAAARERLEDE